MIFLYEPGIDFDKVQRHPVCARGQLERLCDDVSTTHYVVTTTDVAEVTASGNCFAVPALESVKIIFNQLSRR